MTPLLCPMPSRNFLRKMYGRYKGSFEPVVSGTHRPVETPWYSLNGGESISRRNMQWHAGPRINRFKHIRHPGNLKRAVRKEMRRVLQVSSPAAPIMHSFTGVVRYAATSAVLFCVLLFVFNIQAYGNVFSYWWMSAVGNSAHASEAFAAVEQAPKEYLPVPEVTTTPGASPTLSPDTAELPINPPDNRIMIPKIGQNIPIRDVDPTNLLNQDWQALEKDIQEALKEGVVHYPGTAKPGQNGNVFVTGHSSYYLWDPGRYKDVFALLHEMAIGDTITVFYEENRFDYRVTEIKVVRPDEVDVLQQTGNKRITLMTCTPIGTAINRLIVIAEQVE